MIVGMRDVVLKKGYAINIPSWKDNLLSSLSGRRNSFRVNDRGIRNSDIKIRKSHFLSELYIVTK